MFCVKKKKNNKMQSEVDALKETVKILERRLDNAVSALSIVREQNRNITNNIDEHAKHEKMIRETLSRFRENIPCLIREISYHQNWVEILKSPKNIKLLVDEINSYQVRG